MDRVAPFFLTHSVCCLHCATKIADFELLEYSQPWLLEQNVTSLL